LISSCFGRGALTDVVLTPQSSAAGEVAGAEGVSTNSNDSSEVAFEWSDMIDQMAKRMKLSPTAIEL
jgi:hypothetical protein